MYRVIWCFFSSKEGVFLKQRGCFSQAKRVFFSSKEGVIIAPQSPFLGGKIRLQILQIFFNQISRAHTCVRALARERKNSDASAALKLLTQFSSASFTLCIVATLRKALAIIGEMIRWALFRIERNQRAVNALKAPLGG